MLAGKDWKDFQSCLSKHILFRGGDNPKARHQKIELDHFAVRPYFIVETMTVDITQLFNTLGLKM
jgi:hypothetical protein